MNWRRPKPSEGAAHGGSIKIHDEALEAIFNCLPNGIWLVLEMQMVSPRICARKRLAGLKGLHRTNRLEKLKGLKGVKALMGLNEGIGGEGDDAVIVTVAVVVRLLVIW